MHEAGLAAAVADALRREGVEAVDGAHIRLLVSGGHSEPADFDDSFRFHLATRAPEYDAAAIEIVHLPVDRLCVGCGEPFAAVASDEPCPRCGGSGLPVPTPEKVEIELVRPDARVT
jgi:Zn finger protein HypA/HybF involved in hydrogenase expression